MQTNIFWSNNEFKIFGLEREGELSLSSMLTFAYRSVVMAICCVCDVFLRANILMLVHLARYQFNSDLPSILLASRIEYVLFETTEVFLELFLDESSRKFWL
jgi:hypothetical protein